MSQTITEEIKPAYSNEFISLDEIFTELETWRNQNVNAGSAIPDHLWEKIFRLTKHFSHEKIKAIFGVSNSQYNKKRQEFIPESLNPEKKLTPPSPVDFCEVKTAQSRYPSLDKLATHTIVVEFCRPDGQIMKIHTVNSNFKTLIQLFFEGDGCVTNNL